MVYSGTVLIKYRVCEASYLDDEVLDDDGEDDDELEHGVGAHPTEDVHVVTDRPAGHKGPWPHTHVSAS